MISHSLAARKSPLFTLFRSFDLMGFLFVFVFLAGSNRVAETGQVTISRAIKQNGVGLLENITPTTYYNIYIYTLVRSRLT